MSSVTPGAAANAAEARALYIDLLKKCLTFSLWEAKDGSHKMYLESPTRARLRKLLGKKPPETYTEEEIWRRRQEGRDWPRLAHTMIGQKRIDNLQFCVEDVIQRGVPGDFIETGVWRGGACIFMRGIAKAYGVTDRVVWVADSFEGLPPPDPEKYPADRDDIHSQFKVLGVSQEEVAANFEKYGLKDDQVRFLKGWFKDTLPAAPIKQLAVARLDGDLYESTMDALNALYPKLSVGGYLIVDDYGAVPACKLAVEDYRRAHGIDDQMTVIDWGGVFWQRSK